MNDDSPYRSAVLPDPGRTSDLTPEFISRLLDNVLPGRRVAKVEPLAGGLINANFKLQLDSESENEVLVLRIYTSDPTACQKEVDIYQRIRGTVPVPEVIHAAPDGANGVGPFVVLRYVEGLTFRELRLTRDSAAIAEAAFEVGRTLAAIGRYRFARSGGFLPGLEIGGSLVEGPDSIAKFCDGCVASPNFQRRVPEKLAQQVQNFARQWSAELAWLDNERSLVHSDFGSRNVLVRRRKGKWAVAAIIDWEFAFSGSPILDIGNFLRYERRLRPLLEPHFSRGFVEGGGTLGAEWRQAARAVDLTALCEKLTRNELPGDVENELVELIRATIEDRDPQ